jgi:hypothetical protein
LLFGVNFTPDGRRVKAVLRKNGKLNLNGNLGEEPCNETMVALRADLNGEGHPLTLPGFEISLLGSMIRLWIF